MVVPERYRVAAGKREWKYSLETSDESEARLRHAEKLAESQFETALVNMAVNARDAMNDAGELRIAA